MLPKRAARSAAICGREIGSDLVAVAEELVADAAVFFEEQFAGRRVAGGGSQVVVEAPHRGQLFLGGARADVAPALVDEAVDLFVLVQCEAAKLIDGNVVCLCFLRHQLTVKNAIAVAGLEKSTSRIRCWTSFDAVAYVHESGCDGWGFVCGQHVECGKLYGVGLFCVELLNPDSGVISGLPNSRSKCK